MRSAYADLSRTELARLVPELLLIGQLIDRSGMAWCIARLGREGMLEVAIEEWMAASPIYTGRMQRALGYDAPEGEGDVVTIFKGLQLDIGAPPQFMDFRYAVHDPQHGEFWLDHCGALMDVEPMGEDYVRGMCHDIEDPTFDATAVATNPRAQVRPVHRPPRTPADRSAEGRPHCRWTVTIDPSHPPVQESEGCTALRGTVAATCELDPVDPADEGRADYAGPLLSDLDFAAFSHSALVRIADEVCLQMHLLNLGFVRAVHTRLDPEAAAQVCLKQLVGIAGLAADRLRGCLDLPRDEAGNERLLALHPVRNPASYLEANVVAGTTCGRSDGGWLALADHPDVTAAITNLDPDDVAEEVLVARMSSGAGWTFEPRRSLPVYPV
jgi:hypothetical protein